MIQPQHTSSVRQQCIWLEVNRPTLYYKPRPVGDADTVLANRLHELWLAMPFYGYRRFTAQLQREGHAINHKRVKRLMDDAGIQAIYPKPRLSGKDGTQPWPYLLKDIEITHPHHVWGTDITYVRLPSGFVYVIALMDLYSRYIVSWGVFNTMEVASCLSVWEKGLQDYGEPHIVNSDQGSQYTSQAWVDALRAAGVKISMDGKGRWADNAHVERLWRTMKYEHIHLQGCVSLPELRSSVGEFVTFYNTQRLHQSLDYHTPDEVYRGVWSPAPLVHYSKRPVVTA